MERSAQCLEARAILFTPHRLSSPHEYLAIYIYSGGIMHRNSL